MMRRKIGGILCVLIGIIIAFRVNVGESNTDKIQKQMIESLYHKNTLVAVKKDNNHKNQKQDKEKSEYKVTAQEQIGLQELGDVEQDKKEEEKNDQEKVAEKSEQKESMEKSSEINCIGVIEISKIGLKVAISEGATLDNLKYSVAHYKETAAIGDKGNCAIAGHRSYAYNEFFNRLDEIEVGDEINLSNGKENFVYEVYDTFVVEPTQVEVLEPCEEAVLTLITCTPIRVATHRLIIKAKKIK